MRGSRLMALAAGVVALALSAANATHTTATRVDTLAYQAGTGDAVVLCTAPVGVNGDEGSGGACFTLDADDTKVVNITINDDVLPKTGGYYSFTDQLNTNGQDLGSGAFCDTISNLAKPAGANYLAVYVDEALGPLDCGTGIGVATHGSIAVTIEYKVPD